MPKTAARKGSKAKKETLTPLLTDKDSLARFSVQVNQLIQNLLGARCLVLGVRETRADGQAGPRARLWVRYKCGLEAPIEDSDPGILPAGFHCSTLEQIRMELTILQQSYKELKPFKMPRKGLGKPKAKGASKSGAGGKAKAVGKAKKGK